VDCFSEEERDFCPSPPKHAKNHLKDGKSKQHVRTVKKVSDKERDGKNRENGKYQAGNKRKYE